MNDFLCECQQLVKYQHYSIGGHSLILLFYYVGNKQGYKSDKKLILCKF